MEEGEGGGCSRWAGRGALRLEAWPGLCLHLLCTYCVQLCGRHPILI